MNTPIKIICNEIEKSGVLPFARFMELSLYHPDGGYYEREKTPGQRGDFYTSVSVGNLFGQLLAFQFAEWLEELRIANCELRIVEAGAHDGQLAKDILSWLQIHRAKLFEKIEYCIIEPSSRRQGWQKKMLAEFEGEILWASDFENLKLKIQNSKLNGIIFSNELLDAFPVQRFGWDAKEKKWFEWGVGFDGEKFIWKRLAGNLQPSTFNLQPELAGILPNGYTVETSPAAEKWWCDAANVLESGRLMTIDYGLTAEEIFSPARANGTLRAYFQHHVSDDILANAGEQDLTSHVNFSAIRKVGEDAGLITEFFQAQSNFLTQILARAVKKKSFGEFFASKQSEGRLVSPKSDEGGLVASKRSEDGWTSNCKRQFQTLTHPEHLGRAFRVLVQSR